MNSYKIQPELRCCANCKHSYYRIGLIPYCNNPKQWIKEAGVQHTGICDNFEMRIYLEDGNEKQGL